MKTRHAVVLVAFMSCAVLVAPRLHATTINPLTTPAIRFVEQNWHFLPLLTSTGVDGVLAWRDAASLNGGNLGVLWFQKLSNGTWQAVAFPSNSLGIAVLTIRAIPGRENAFTAEPDLMLKMLGACGSEDPIKVVQGLLENDPLQPLLVNNPDSPSIIEALALLGWQVAPDLSPLMSGNGRICNSVPLMPIDDFMNAVVASATEHHFGEALDPQDCPDGRPVFCEGCKTTYSDLTGTGQWTRYTVPAMGCRICIWMRSATATATLSGSTVLLCIPCVGTSTVTGCEIHSTIIFDGEACPPAPTEPGLFSPGPCTPV